jgi:hypothetical protein
MRVGCADAAERENGLVTERDRDRGEMGARRGEEAGGTGAQRREDPSQRQLRARPPAPPAAVSLRRRGSRGRVGEARRLVRERERGRCVGAMGAGGSDGSLVVVGWEGGGDGSEGA